MSEQPQGGEEPRVVIRDKRRIDPTSGAVRAPAGAPPGPAERGKWMTENETPTASAPAADSDLTRQLAERTEDLQRVTAEYANYRRRVDRDRALVADQAAARFATHLFPIIDDIERARDHGELTGGFKMVADRIVGLLDGLGVTAYGVNGDPFDPALHEAVMHDVSPDVDYPMVTTVLRQGYRRGERVLRHAMVAVTDPAAPPAPAAPGAAEPSSTDARASD